MSIKKNVQLITEAMESLGTYKPEYDMAIRNMAENMEARDRAFKLYQKGEGSLKDYRDLDGRVLDYMKELSLTHQRMKRRSEANAIASPPKPSLFDALANITDE